MKNLIVKVIVKCVGSSGAKKEIGAGEIAPGDVPM